MMATHLTWDVLKFSTMTRLASFLLCSQWCSWIEMSRTLSGLGLGDVHMCLRLVSVVAHSVTLQIEWNDQGPCRNPILPLHSTCLGKKTTHFHRHAKTGLVEPYNGGFLLMTLISLEGQTVTTSLCNVFMPHWKSEILDAVLLFMIVCLHLVVHHSHVLF